MASAMERDVARRTSQTSAQALVSVVIPTYNRAHIVRRAIDSALGQSHSNVEVILVDDGSTDRTRALIEETYRDESRLRYFQQKNAGVSAARNRGLAEVRGEFVGLLDSDDAWLPWKIALQLECLRRVPGAGMVWSDMVAVDERAKVISERYLRQMYRAYRWFKDGALFSNSETFDFAEGPGFAAGPAEVHLFWGDIFSQMIMGNLVHTSTVLLRRERLDRVGGFNEDLKFSGEDYDFHLRTCREGPVAFVDVATILYTVGAADQLTQSPYGVHMAANALTVVRRTIDSDRSRIHLPHAMLRSRLAAVHAWVGQELAAAGRRREARTLFWQSARYQPWRPRSALLAVAMTLPDGVYNRLRQLRARLRPRPASD